MRNDRASTTGEVVVLMPVLFLILMLTVSVGRVTHASIILQHVADVASRDASMASRARSSQIAAMSAQRELAKNNVECHQSRVTSQIIQVGRETAITVALTCRTASPSSFLFNFLSIPIRTESTAVIDRYRGE